jgi:uncharacterized surface anchored protein
MLNIDTLQRNKSVFNPNKDLQNNGIGIWDLTASSMDFTNINLKLERYFTLREDYQMRPDLLALQAYGSLSYTGSLMKVNFISNPFAMQEGDLIVVPVVDQIEATFNLKQSTILKGNTSNNPNQRFRDAQEQKKFKISNSRQQFLEKRNGPKNPPAQILPSNIAQAEERQTVRTNVVVGLGPDVSNSLPNPAGNLN